MTRGTKRDKSFTAGESANARRVATITTIRVLPIQPSAHKITRPRAIQASIAIGISRLCAHFDATSGATLTRNLLRLLLSKGMNVFLSIYYQRRLCISSIQYRSEVLTAYYL